MTFSHRLAAAAVLSLCLARPAFADSLVSPPPPAAAGPVLADTLVQPGQPAGVARPAPVQHPGKPAPTADTRPECGCAPAPAPLAVADAAPDGTPITGDLSRVRPSERLLGREQALRARFERQLHAGERPWLPVADDN
jgi:hypothetical protein